MPDNIADKIRIRQRFDPKGEDGGYSCEQLADEVEPLEFTGDWAKHAEQMRELYDRMTNPPVIASGSLGSDLGYNTDTPDWGASSRHTQKAPHDSLEKRKGWYGATPPPPPTGKDLYDKIYGRIKLDPKQEDDDDASD